MIRKRIASIVAMALASSSFTLAQTPDTTKLRKEWGPEFATKGSELRFHEKLREKPKEFKGRTVVVYELEASGLPRDQHYVLWVWPNDKDPTPLEREASLDEVGKVVAGSEHKPVVLVTFASKGESLRAALISRDGEAKSFAKIVPFPIESRQGACRITAEQVILATAYAVSGEGFRPNEEISIACQCEKDSKGGRVSAAPDGTWTAVVFPVVPGKRTGTTKVEILSQSCKFSLDLSWGEAARKYE